MNTDKEINLLITPSGNFFYIESIQASIGYRGPVRLCSGKIMMYANTIYGEEHFISTTIFTDINQSVVKYG